MAAPPSSSLLVGARLALVTNTDERIEGELFAYDRDTGFIVLKSSAGGDGRKANFRMVKQTHVRDLHVLGLPTAPAAPLPALDCAALTRRRDKVVEQKARLFGLNVSADAQDIFDALSRTLPCQWSGTDIIVLEEVIIRAPYTSESCKPHARGADNAVARVRKVLEGERKRLGLK